LSKSFATTVSPWVVTLEALAPFRVAALAQEPAPLAYLTPKQRQTYAIAVELALGTPAQPTPQRLCATNYREVYWTMAQQLAHHTVNGCRMEIGDLLASGTISGHDRGSWGSLLEMTFNGTEPVTLPGGEQRRFLEDGDEVVMRAYCEAPGGAYRIGFGAAAGRIEPAMR
jgi:fumarylacetoacetase